MVRVENLIVEGNFFYPSKHEANALIALKSRINGFMEDKGYLSDSVLPEYNNFFTLSYYLHFMDRDLTLIEKLKLYLCLTPKSEIKDRKHVIKLSRTRNDIALRVDFGIYELAKRNNHEGYLIRVNSEPVILYKIRQLGYNHNLDEFTYSDIVHSNKHFVDEIIMGLGGTKLEATKTLTDIIKPPIVDRLNELGFVRIANLLKQGMEKVERGDIEDGLTDLRSALEMFVYDVVEKKNHSPCIQHKLKENLNILQAQGYIDENMTRLVHNVLITWLYPYLSDQSVHKREKINLIDARFLFNLTEEIMEFMLQRVIIYRV
jgi:hypothetical protein